MSVIGRPDDVALGEQLAGRPGKLGLVALLDAVLALAVAVDEAEQVGGEGRPGRAAGLRVDPDRFGLERDALERPVGDRLAGSARRSVSSRPRVEDDVRPGRSSILSVRARVGVAVEAEDRRPASSPTSRRSVGVSWSGEAATR